MPGITHLGTAPTPRERVPASVYAQAIMAHKQQGMQKQRLAMEQQRINSARDQALKNYMLRKRMVEGQEAARGAATSLEAERYGEARDWAKEGRERGIEEFDIREKRLTESAENLAEHRRAGREGRSSLGTAMGRRSGGGGAKVKSLLPWEGITPQEQNYINSYGDYAAIVGLVRRGKPHAVSILARHGMSPEVADKFFDHVAVDISDKGAWGTADPVGMQRLERDEGMRGLLSAVDDVAAQLDGLPQVPNDEREAKRRDILKIKGELLTPGADIPALVKTLQRYSRWVKMVSDEADRSAPPEAPSAALIPSLASPYWPLNTAGKWALKQLGVAGRSMLESNPVFHAGRLLREHRDESSREAELGALLKKLKMFKDRGNANGVALMKKKIREFKGEEVTPVSEAMSTYKPWAQPSTDDRAPVERDEGFVVPGEARLKKQSKKYFPPPEEAPSNPLAKAIEALPEPKSPAKKKPYMRAKWSDIPEQKEKVGRGSPAMQRLRALDPILRWAKSAGLIPEGRAAEIELRQELKARIAAGYSKEELMQYVGRVSRLHDAEMAAKSQERKDADERENLARARVEKRHGKTNLVIW